MIKTDEIEVHNSTCKAKNRFKKGVDDDYFVHSNSCQRLEVEFYQYVKFSVILYRNGGFIFNTRCVFEYFKGTY